MVAIHGGRFSQILLYACARSLALACVCVCVCVCVCGVCVCVCVCVCEFNKSMMFNLV